MKKSRSLEFPWKDLFRAGTQIKFRPKKWLKIRLPRYKVGPYLIHRVSLRSLLPVFVHRQGARSHNDSVCVCWLGNDRRSEVMAGGGGLRSLSMLPACVVLLCVAQCGPVWPSVVQLTDSPLLTLLSSLSLQLQSGPSPLRQSDSQDWGLRRGEETITHLIFISIILAGPVVHLLSSSHPPPSH